jgi:hypothetical protein
MADASTGKFEVGALSASYRQEGSLTYVTLHRAGNSSIGPAVLGATAEDLAKVVAELVDRGLVQLPVMPTQKREALKKKIAELGIDATVSDPADYKAHDWCTAEVLAVVVVASLTLDQMRLLLVTCRETFKDNEVVIR